MRNPYELSLARCNIRISINRILFRITNEISEEKRKNLESEVNDLNYVLAVLSKFEQKHEQMFKDNHRLAQEVLKTRLELKALQDEILDKKREL